MYTHRMIIAALFTSAVFVGCAKEAAPPVTPEEPATTPDEWGPQSPQPAWWNDNPPCPDDAKLVGAAPPNGNVLQCLKPNGVNHGYESVWFPNGHEGTLTHYKNGLPDGKWMHWFHGRKMVEGEYKDGRKHGKWTYWFDEMSDFDTQGQMKVELPVVVEIYNHGMIVTRERQNKGAPETMSPEEPHQGPPPKPEAVTVQSGQPAPTTGE